jgi:hypothetical protein
MDLVMELDGFLDKEFCEEIINKAEQETRTNEYGLNICRYREWNEITDKLRKSIKLGHSKYIEWLNVILPKIPDKIINAENIDFRIENHATGYEWISPLFNNESQYIFFIHLNDISEGGETNFLYKKVQPKTGKLVVFPSTWTSFHMGLPAENNKYVIIGSFYSKAP